MDRFEPNLRIPGPTALPPSVREAGARQMINHRGPEFAAMLGRILDGVKPYFGTTNDVAMLTCAGSGGLEAVTITLSLMNQMVPPTAGYVSGDPGVELDIVAPAARRMKFDYAISNSFGFGGTNCSLVFRRCQ